MSSIQALYWAERAVEIAWAAIERERSKHPEHEDVLLFALGELAEARAAIRASILDSANRPLTPPAPRKNEAAGR